MISRIYRTPKGTDVWLAHTRKGKKRRLPQSDRQTKAVNKPIDIGSKPTIILRRKRPNE